MKKELPKKLLDILACPQCKGDLLYKKLLEKVSSKTSGNKSHSICHKKAEQRLLCKKCLLAYRIEQGIPIMLVEEAEKI